MTMKTKYIHMLVLTEEEIKPIYEDFLSWCENEQLLDDDMPDAVGRFSEVRELTEEETEALWTVV